MQRWHILHGWQHRRNCLCGRVVLFIHGYTAAAVLPPHTLIHTPHPAPYYPLPPHPNPPHPNPPNSTQNPPQPYASPTPPQLHLLQHRPTPPHSSPPHLFRPQRWAWARRCRPLQLLQHSVMSGGLEGCLSCALAQRATCGAASSHGGWLSHPNGSHSPGLGLGRQLPMGTRDLYPLSPPLPPRLVTSSSSPPPSYPLPRWLEGELAADSVWVPAHSREAWPEKADICVVSYTLATKMAARLQRRQLQVVIADESQFLKNHRSQRSQAPTPPGYAPPHTSPPPPRPVSSARGL